MCRTIRGYTICDKHYQLSNIFLLATAPRGSCYYKNEKSVTMNTIAVTVTSNDTLEIVKKRKLDDIVIDNKMLGSADSSEKRKDDVFINNDNKKKVENNKPSKMTLTETTAAEALTMLASKSNQQIWQSFNGTIPLSMKEDTSWLIPLHCFVRKYLHIFQATEKDLKRHNNGKAKPVQIGQIGICCNYCLNCLPREEMKAGVYFPSTMHNIYSASLNLLTRHMPICETFPIELKHAYESLKYDEGRSASSKKYWYDSARKLGLIDTDFGIRYAPSSSSTNLSLSKDLLQTISLPLVIPEDAIYTTDYIYYIMKQYQKCHLLEADRIGRRRSCPINFPGLECTHCQSNNTGFHFGSRLFPTSFKSFSDTTKTISKMDKHLLKCRDCPMDVKAILVKMKVNHDQQKREMRVGSLKAFCTRVWNRLHDNSMPVL